MDCGPLYHSLNAVMIYRERMQPEQIPQTVLKPTVVPTSAGPVITPQREVPAANPDAPVSAMFPANRR